MLVTKDPQFSKVPFFWAVQDVGFVSLGQTAHIKLATHHRVQIIAEINQEGAAYAITKDGAEGRP
jgi:hypothetical protein